MSAGASSNDLRIARDLLHGDLGNGADDYDGALQRAIDYLDRQANAKDRAAARRSTRERTDR